MDGETRTTLDQRGRDKLMGALADIGHLQDEHSDLSETLTALNTTIGQIQAGRWAPLWSAMGIGVVVLLALTSGYFAFESTQNMLIRDVSNQVHEASTNTRVTAAIVQQIQGDQASHIQAFENRRESLQLELEKVRNEAESEVERHEDGRMHR